MKAKFPSGFRSRAIPMAATFVLTVSTTHIYGQTFEIDPTTPIPTTLTSAFQTEWNTDGATESWTADQITLDAGAPVSGILTGTITGNDPKLIRTGTNIGTGDGTIIEFSLKKEAGDTSRIDLFWTDDSGGFSTTNSFRIPAGEIPSDGEFHTVRITFSGQLEGNLTAIRFDPAADAPGNGTAVSVDYFRIFSEAPANPPLIWDPNQTGGVSGGAGLWDTTSNFWWNGTAQTNWPATSNGDNRARLNAPAGTITIQPAGITAAELDFTAASYTLAGGPLTLDGIATVRAPGNGNIFIEAPLAGSADTIFASGGYSFSAASTQTGQLHFRGSRLVVGVDNALGSGPVILGNGGNFFLSSAGEPRSISNNVEIRSNRFISQNTTFVPDAESFETTLEGDVTLNLSSPGDIFIRKPIAMNGVVSGTGVDGKSLFFDGDAGVLTLGNASNTFVGNIQWNNSSTLVAGTDGSLGDVANILVFNAGEGALQQSAAFDIAREVTINGGAAGILRSDFDSTWTGPLPVIRPENTRFFKAGTGKLTLDTTVTLGGGTQTRGGILEVGPGGTLIHGGTWDNNHGVAGGATFRVNGGSFQIPGSFYGVGNGINPDTEALFEMTAGTYTHTGGALLVGFKGNGRFVLDDGAVTLNQINYGDGEAGRTANVELNGGTLAMAFADRRVRWPHLRMPPILFNGTTLSPVENQADYLRSGTDGTTTFLVGDGGAKFDTAGFDMGIVNTLQTSPSLTTADGGLTKTGIGSLFLTGAQTYNGATTVSAGSFGGNGSLQSSVTVAPGAGLAVQIGQTGGTAGVDFSQLNVNGTLALPDSLNIRVLPGAEPFTEANGTLTVATASAGITGFNAANVTFDTTGFTGTGTFTADVSGNSLVLNYSAGSASGFSAFAGTITNAALRGPLDDADGDGVSNLIEYVLGGDPNISDPSVRPEQTVNASDVTIDFSIREAAATDTTVNVEVSTDLVDWTTIAPIPVTGSGPQSVTVPRGSATKLFLRVAAELNVP